MKTTTNKMSANVKAANETTKVINSACSKANAMDNSFEGRCKLIAEKWDIFFAAFACFYDFDSLPTEPTAADIMNLYPAGMYMDGKPFTNKIKTVAPATYTRTGKVLTEAVKKTEPTTEGNWTYKRVLMGLFQMKYCGGICTTVRAYERCLAETEKLMNELGC